MKIYIQYIILVFFLLSLKSYSEEPFWELTMAPPVGLVKDLKVSYDNIIYLSSYNGIFRSTNNGGNWEWIISGNFDRICVFKDNIISIKYNGSNNNAFISTDKGLNWNEMKGSWNTWQDINNLFYDNGTIYLMMETTSGKKIYFSKDLGLSWDSTVCLNPPKIHFFNKFQFKIQHGVIAIGTLAKEDVDNPVISTSRDFGKSWKMFFKPPISVFDIHIIDSLTYFIATSNGIFKTDDGGENWNNFALQGIWAFKILITDDNKTFIVTAENGINYSIDSGKTWNKTNDSLGLDWYRSYGGAIAKDSSGFYYVSPWAYGVFRTKDLGSHWERINNGFSGWGAKDIAFSAKGDIFMTSYGIFQSTVDNWQVWKNDGFYEAQFGPIVINDKNEVFIGNYGPIFDENQEYDTGLYRSTDNGNTWEIFSKGMGTPNSVTSIVLHKKTNVFLCSNRFNNILRSTDNCENWKHIKNAYGDILGINDEGKIYAFSSGQIFQSTDDGLTWKCLDSVYKGVGGDIEPGGRVIFNKLTKTAFYGPIDGFSDFSWLGCYKTTDNGNTWFKDTLNEKSYVPKCLAVDSTYNWVAAYDNDGIYRSTDNGITWQQLDSTGIRYKIFKSMAVSPDGHIFVSAANGGLYRSRDKFVSVQEKKRDINDGLWISNTPGTDLINIKFNLVLPSDVTLTVFDLMGRAIETKNYGYNYEGEITILFDASSYSSGIYTYRITAGKETKAGIMNLVK